MAGPVYRAGQFLAALRAQPLDDTELDLVQAYLPPRALTLFRTMPTADQRHSLMILQGLLAQGYRDLPLLQAALLHDSAKQEIGLAYRTLVILLNAVSPRLLPRLARSDPLSWRYPLYLSLRHPSLGADAAEQAGADHLAVQLIREHQSPGPEEGPLAVWHRALKALDDEN